ncbi:MAG TPA: serine hydrolase domain-containing protein, partial [Planctomycetaceae bacterium]|nr:serine hydrolase domain-containing protein [Planctomycetaceae bacterium]
MPAPVSPPPKVTESTPTKPLVPPPTVKPVTVASKPHPVDNAEDLEAFFDGALMVQLESKHIAGAVVAVVVGDKLVFSKGYGYADVETGRPVDPQTTLFRIASVSKLFTWTAVMQLVEEGKLDLDADVNVYLKGTGVQIPPAFGKPITLKNLLTHSAGFEDRPIGLFAHQPSDKPLAESLKNDIPARVRPPGTLSA